MPTKYRNYTEVPGNVPPDVPLWLNASLAEIDADMEDVEKASLPAIPVKCVRREAGAWVWDRTAAATHYLLTDHTGAYVVRASPHPIPDATPSFTW